MLELDSRLKKETYFFLMSMLLVFGTLQTLGGLTGTERPMVTVTSCSMYPSYSVGDVVFLKGADTSSVEVNDTIVFSRSESRAGTPIIHRVIEKSGDTVATKGDNNPSQLPFEDEITDDRIYGKAVFSLPYLGVVKLLGLDLTGIGPPNMGSGLNQPLSIDNVYACRGA